jgi:hypothetical protein
VSAVQTLEALRILKTRLAAIDQEHDAEFAVQHSEREVIDAKAEAQALSAIFDFLKECKITLPDSLLRIFRRYLHTSKHENPIPELEDTLSEVRIRFAKVAGP